jgi:hypothetical protein
LFGPPPPITNEHLIMILWVIKINFQTSWWWSRQVGNKWMTFWMVDDGNKWVVKSAYGKPRAKFGGAEPVEVGTGTDGNQATATASENVEPEPMETSEQSVGEPASKVAKLA